MFSPHQVPTEIEEIMDCSMGCYESLALGNRLKPRIPRYLILVASCDCSAPVRKFGFKNPSPFFNLLPPSSAYNGFGYPALPPLAFSSLLCD